MWSLVSVLCLAVLASAEPRFRRLAPCNNNWSLPSNPCKPGQNQVYFPHPSDSSSFLQCDMQGRMYMIRCPAGMLFNQATTSCQAQTVTTQVPTNPGTSSKFCTAQNIAAGRIYWAVPGVINKFIECGPNGGATILTCPALLVWDQTKTSCVYASVNGNIPVTPTTSTGTGVTGGPGAGFKNPCTSSSAVAGKLYYAYPDVHKFIQCDTNGDAFVVSCPGGLIWNTVLETCFSPYQTALNAIG